MLLYTTVLKIKNKLVAYQVSLQEDCQLLLFKPELPLTSASDIPIFWVAKQNNTWTPVNVQDRSIIAQVELDIQAHGIE